MALIQADNPEIEKELIRLEELVEEGGGGTHSDLIICCNNGDLSLQTKDVMAPGREIIRLSRDVLLPSEQVNVHVKNGAFLADFPKDSTFSTLQKKLMETMMTLYTLTNKADLHKQYSFLLSVAAYPDILNKIEEGRGVAKDFRKWRAIAEKKPTGQALDTFISETFLKTRYLGYNDQIKFSSLSILMPIIDFMNHHWEGASFSMGRGVRPGDLCVETSQPVDGNRECYAFYGVMDAMDALIRYDFVDSSAPVVRSVPIDLEIPDIGLIKINSALGAMNTKSLPKSVADLSRYMPVITKDPENNILILSHIFIPVVVAPLSMRRILHYALTSLAGKDMEASVRALWIKDAEQKIVDKNKLYYRELRGLAGADNPGLKRITDLSDLQLSKLDAYRFIEE